MYELKYSYGFVNTEIELLYEDDVVKSLGLFEEIMISNAKKKDELASAKKDFYCYFPQTYYVVFDDSSFVMKFYGSFLGSVFFPLYESIWKRSQETINNKIVKKISMSNKYRCSFLEGDKKGYKCAIIK